MTKLENAGNECGIFSDLTRRLILLLAIAWISYVALLLVTLPPYWALMDDHTHIQGVSRAQEIGFVHFVKDAFTGDGGMLRPCYAAFIYIFYGTFHRSSLAAYLAIFVLNVAIFFGWGWAFARCVCERAGGQGPTRKEKVTWCLLFVILCFHFIRNNNLFYFASLQERLAILFLAPAIHLMLNLSKGNFGTGRKLFQMFLVYVFAILAVLSKAPAVSFLPVFAAWFLMLAWPLEKRSVLFAIAALGLIFLAVFFANYLYSIRSGYSAGYQFAAITKELGDRGSKFYRVLAFSLFTVFLIALKRFGKNPADLADPADLARELLWPAGMLVYTVIMLPWQGFLNYYLIIPVGMFWVGAKLIVFRESVYWLNKWKQLPYGLFFVCGVALTSITPMWKFYQKAIHHHGTGKAVAYLDERVRKDGNRLTIRVAENCEETATAVGNFLGRPGLTPMALGDDVFYSTPPQRGVAKLLVTHRECTEFPETFKPRHEAFRYGEWVIYEQSA